jgi:hypothetical protein
VRGLYALEPALLACDTENRIYEIAIKRNGTPALTSPSGEE